ncbi:MAG: ribonuclease H [Candidatus Paceibacterota bacterium]
MKILEIYTDGSAKPNPGMGAWAYCAIIGKKPVKIRSELVRKATNNQMELQAVIQALQFAKEEYPDHLIYIYTDSQYVERGINAWMPKWVSNGFNIKNRSRWKHLHNLSKELTIQVQWIRGHNKNKWNEFVDKLCSEIKNEKQ